MFKREFKALSGNKFLFNRRGQVSLLFALMMPIFLLMLGVVLDLGWYYLNVSRLQNAADAAAVAGANALREDEYFSDYKNIKLVGKYPAKDSDKYRVDSIYELTAIENGNVIAEEYVAKNLSSNENTIINSWTKSEVAAEEGLYTKDNNLYYVVKLQEEIRHFFLSGWFNDMTAPVTAVALLSKTAIKGDSADSEENTTMPTMPTSLLDFNDSIFVEPEKLKEIEKILNQNVIVGNWEVQNYYKLMDTKNAYARDEYGDIIADLNTGKPTPATQFESRFGYSVYTERWNHFQDVKNHYKIQGATYRTETINVWDDVVDTNNDGVADTWGNGESGMSNVVATKASTNPYKDTDNASGKPYLEYELDSINVDFKPEITFVEDAAEEDWDFRLGYLTTSCNHSTNYYDWTANKGSYVNNIGILRIHSTINIGKAYKERAETYREKDADGHLLKDTNGNLIPDILWGRIESEPMLFYPDKRNGLESLRKRVYGLSSIRQIIINVKNSNDAEDDRPVILFYDGPETNDIYDDYKERTDVLHNKSLPVILNLNAAFRGVLYAPNSPVVVMGSNTGNFVGFVVAKEYVRLKTTEDFEAEVKADSGKYTRYNDDFTENEAVDNPYYVEDNGNYATKPPFDYIAEPEKINWKYTKITENGIEMYVDNYGNVQYMDYPDAPTQYGTYDNFGRTTFSTHGYTVLKTSANNMLLSGR